MLWFSSSAAALVFYLPGVCTHWHRGKTEKGQSPEHFKKFGKNTIFNEHPVAHISSYSYILCVHKYKYYICFSSNQSQKSGHQLFMSVAYIACNNVHINMVCVFNHTQFWVILWLRAPAIQNTPCPCRTTWWRTSSQRSGSSSFAEWSGNQILTAIHLLNVGASGNSTQFFFSTTADNLASHLHLFWHQS